ncbi:MAG: hypothetical protein ACKO1U_01025 [Bacteroidota bacterium]
MKNPVSTFHLQPKMHTYLRYGNSLEQLVGAICTMDADIVNGFLADAHLCNNTDRETCFDQLVELFAYCERKKDRFFHAFAARCQNSGCNGCSSRSFVFVGDHTGNYIGMKFDLEQGRVIRFKECTSIRMPIATRPGAKELYLSEDPF